MCRRSDFRRTRANGALFEETREILGEQDVLIGHVETPHTTRNLPSCIKCQAPPSNPQHLEVLPDVGFTIATVAGNHLYDCGPYGVIDTVEKLKELGIQPAGGGANITEAKKPAIVRRERRNQSRPAFL
ncbi:MAG: CapA family protein [Lachnospiraceae bacterium]